MTDKTLVKQIQSAITDEIFYALGLRRSGALRRSLGWVFALPVRRFSCLMADVDAAVATGGFPAGSQMMLDALGVRLKAEGVENIPRSGPVVILANHPGAYDSIAIGSLISRTDLKVIVAKARFYQVLPHIHTYLYYASQERSESMIALRQAVRHLQSNGALLQFGSGLIEPEPALYPLDEPVFERWSPSIEIFLRKVPGLKIVPTIASHVLLRRFAEHLLTRLRRKPMDQRRLAEFMQVMQQLVFPKSIEAKPRISFGTPFSLAELSPLGDQLELMSEVLQRIQAQLSYHLQRFDFETAT
ncbi:MAG: 1-acyl-sn-glycerol-3-phosphate acyltransferase [Brevefilum fermentans]|nr:1-acyl-sn-glycerol-3-phosphate acyltransferase [Brevefilum fermentans]MDI9566082.1 hypothetical protein [Chloroflexota bacterium]HOM66642.1 hypothetical protein [Brevefilum fermentans]